MKLTPIVDQLFSQATFGTFFSFLLHYLFVEKTKQTYKKMYKLFEYLYKEIENLPNKLFNCRNNISLQTKGKLCFSKLNANWYIKIKSTPL